jgi:uracil-DNA glycosylase
VTNLTGCQLCPRLAAHRITVKQKFPDYHCAPVAAFGAPDASLLIVGLAPGLHGANASGRPFTGDASGDLLFSTLHDQGFASQAQSRRNDDGMHLIDCRITNAVKCLPPQNKPMAVEINTCNPYLADEIRQLAPTGILLALGSIAHRAIIRALGLRQAAYPFAHGVQYRLKADYRLVDSYHPSRYNINTGKLTPASFARVISGIRELLR